MDKFQTTFTLNNQMSSELGKIISSLEKLDKMTDALTSAIGELDDENLNALNSSLSQVQGGLSDLNKSTALYKNH